jgi:hypothetical protein
LRCNLDYGAFDSFKNLEIPSAAAEDARERYANLIAGCVRMLVQQGFRGDQNCGGAVSALSCAEVGEGVLQRMKISLQAQAFDGQNISGITFNAEDQAGEHGLAIKKNGTRAAFSEFTAMLGAGVAEIFAKDFEQSFVRCERDVDLFTVQRDSNMRCFLGFDRQCDQDKSPLENRGTLSWCLVTCGKNLWAGRCKFLAVDGRWREAGFASKPRIR